MVCPEESDALWVPEGAKLPDSDAGESAEALLERFDALEWIHGYRVVDADGLLDIEATARKLSIPVIFDKKLTPDGQIKGLGDSPDPLEILINDDHSDARQHVGRQRLTFGHEVGHYFLSEVLGMDFEHHATERYCELFGHEMALPRTKLADIGTVDKDTIVRLMAENAVWIDTVMVQLMAVGKLPEHAAIDTRIENVPNPLYAGKIKRRVWCWPSLTEGECDGAFSEVPVFDFTEYAWSGHFSSCLEYELPPELLEHGYVH